MKHRLRFRKFSRNPSHRRAMFRNLATSLIKHDGIETTIHKAKDLRRIAEKIVTITKKGIDNSKFKHAQQQLEKYLFEKEVAELAVSTFPLRFAGREGGYIKITPLGRRKGDNAKMAYIQYIDEDKIPSQQEIEQFKKDQLQKDYEKNHIHTPYTLRALQEEPRGIIKTFEIIERTKKREAEKLEKQKAQQQEQHQNELNRVEYEGNDENVKQ